MSRPAIAVPTYEPDLYSTQAILDPYPHYARLRQLGPVVWLPKQRVYALARYTECKTVLRHDDGFISGEGVGLSAVFNKLSRGGTTLNSDGEEHDRRRKLLAHRMLPRACESSTRSSTAKPGISSRMRFAGATSTASRISLRRFRFQWYPTWSVGPPGTGDSTCCAGAVQRSMCWVR